jgi:hypothetical protein
MKWLRNQTILFGIILIVLSAAVYLIHFFIFRDPHHIFLYLIGDIAFVFIEVLMVTLVLHKILHDREKRHRLEKLNMVIGSFFSRVGTQLLVYFSEVDPDLPKIRDELMVSTNWTDEEFKRVRSALKQYKYTVEIHKVNLELLKSFLMEKCDLLLRILENPNLLEHERITDLLHAVFHLAEELEARKSFNDLPESDLAHLSGDIRRAYALLVEEWLHYMEFLKKYYPYLFSLAMRINPFKEDGSPIVK